MLAIWKLFKQMKQLGIKIMVGWNLLISKRLTESL